MFANLSSSQRAQLAQETRVRLVADAGRAMQDVGHAVQERLTELMHEAVPARESQVRRDVWSAYQKRRNSWVQDTIDQWQAALKPPVTVIKLETDMSSLQLVETDVVENKIVASRLVVAVLEKISSQFDDLRLRIKLLEGTDELLGSDILRPEVLLLALVEQWTGSGMPNYAWAMVNDGVQRLLTERLKAAYTQANTSLVEQGVLPTITLKDRVKPVRSGTGSGGAGAGSGAVAGSAVAVSSADTEGSGSGSAGGGSAPTNVLHGGAGSGRVGNAGSSGGAGGVYEETRMLTATTPLVRARGRAQGIMGQLKRLLVGQAEVDFDATVHAPASPALAAAMAVRPVPGRVPGLEATAYADGDTVLQDHSSAGVAKLAGQLRQQSTELKKKAETKNEKATIEIVALMFQAILQEDRIPPGIRVWFSRLQMPVLRVALEEPDFFGTLDHPARQLIDRMGLCVMGFDASGVQGAALEAEVKRIVQVIEQYPETGRRVYQLVYQEFQTFLAKFLTNSPVTQKVVNVAQLVEQKETLTIQYTIEMRNTFKDVPVRDEIRIFLFKVWAEVLAVAAVRHGETLELKKTATDLVWAASAKPNRADRARVIKELPHLLQRLRAGMTLLGLSAPVQDAHVKTVSDTLADAFLSKTQAIPQAQIDAMAERLAHLEDFVSEDEGGASDSDLPLDAESIEMMLGIDASTIDVIADGGSKPTPAMQSWAKALQLGAWFTLDHSGHVRKVQFAWRSQRKHLNLFASSDGHSYLIQAGRLGAYLQAGLLLPQEEEALTVRATRKALAKIEANPERLLA